MKTVLHKSEERGRADYGWLDARFSFSFGSWQNRDKVHFGALRVLNDDRIAASMGFGKHPHDNMEIVTIPLAGALKHADSTGGQGIISKGEVQIMSAGSGIEHSEMNASHTEDAFTLQIWVFPKEQNIKPRYDQRDFRSDLVPGKFRTLVSPYAEADDAMWINQDAWFSIGRFETAADIDYAIRRNGNGVYAFVLEGNAAVAGQTLGRRDAAGIWETEQVTFSVSEGTELLLIDVPMEF
ncbi:MAG: pirin family protein [Bacteroidia bacterium]